MTLPAHATEASHKRYRLAIELVQSCPPELGEEIALTGSTARGLADADSDLELNLWSETIPPVEARVAWLESAGVEEIEVFERPRNDGSYWIGGRLGDVSLEVGWQKFDIANEHIEALLVNDVQHPSRHIPLELGDMLANALVLRTSGKLGIWQDKLRAYSDMVQRAVIQDVLDIWSRLEFYAGDIHRLAQHRERLSLIFSLITVCLNPMMSLLYAVNRRWEPKRKWTLTIARDLAIMPERWRERIDDILTAPPEESVHLCVELMLDALALVPPQYDVSAAVAALHATKQSAERRRP